MPSGTGYGSPLRLKPALIARFHSVFGDFLKRAAGNPCYDLQTLGHPPPAFPRPVVFRIQKNNSAGCVLLQNRRMNRKKAITCPHCETEQVVHLLAATDKPAVPIDTQTVECVECGRDFPVPDTQKIVDGPYEV